VKPSFISSVRSQDGAAIYKNKVETKKALDPRVAYILTNMMEEVLRSGTAASVRGKYGFTVPAAGKTGTSFDGWFAGYTSELLCIVWVGFDDNRELKLEGAHSAAPIWAEFMKKALTYHEYRDAKPFRAPEGIVSEMIDPLNGMLATSQCPGQRTEVYIAGSEPVQVCPIHGGRIITTTVSGWDATPAASPAPNLTPDAVARRAARQIPPDPAPAQPPPPPPPAQPNHPAKKGWLRRIFGHRGDGG
jgi:penicillin-binding protein 1B